MKTHVGVDLHQRLCYLTAVDASGKTFKQGQVVVEASGFWPAFARAAAPELERLVMVHPQRIKAIASAKLKNDRVDSETLAHLSRCDLLPEAWMADEATQQLRLRVRLRITLGRQRARAKNRGPQRQVFVDGVERTSCRRCCTTGCVTTRSYSSAAESRLWLRAEGICDGCKENPASSFILCPPGIRARPREGLLRWSGRDSNHPCVP